MCRNAARQRTPPAVPIRPTTHNLQRTTPPTRDCARLTRCLRADRVTGVPTLYYYYYFPFLLWEIVRRWRLNDNAGHLLVSGSYGYVHGRCHHLLVYLYTGHRSANRPHRCERYPVPNRECRGRTKVGSKTLYMHTCSKFRLVSEIGSFVFILLVVF